MLKEEPEMC